MMCFSCVVLFLILELCNHLAEEERELIEYIDNI